MERYIKKHIPISADPCLALAWPGHGTAAGVASAPSHGLRNCCSFSSGGQVPNLARIANLFPTKFQKWCSFSSKTSFIGNTMPCIW